LGDDKDHSEKSNGIGSGFGIIENIDKFQEKYVEFEQIGEGGAAVVKRVVRKSD
jgi:hypothetical protein